MIRQLARALIFGAAVVACTPAGGRGEPPPDAPSASPPTVSMPDGPSQYAETATPSPTVEATGTATPSPTVEVAVDPSMSPSSQPPTIEQAGAAYLAFAEPLSKAREAAVQTAPCAWQMTVPCSAKELMAGKQYWAIVATALDAYLAGVKPIQFPDAAAVRANTLIDAAKEFHRWALAASRSETVDEFNTSADSAVRAIETWAPAEQELLDALGLPVGP